MLLVRTAPTLPVVAGEPRSEYHHQLQQIDAGMSLQLAITEESIAGAQDALLAAEPAAIKAVANHRDEIARVHRSLEALVVTQIARHAPVAGDLRRLIAVLRILPEIELTANLAADIARRGAMHLDSEITPRIRGLATKLFEQGSAMWRMVADAYAEPPDRLVETLETRDEEIGELHTSLMSELTSGILRPPVLAEMALIARFLERIGDHAVEAARWIETIPHPAGDS